MDIIKAAALPEAVVLFNGSDITHWTTRAGTPARWRVEGGVLEVVPGMGDIMSMERFTDFFLHLEFRCPDMPEATGQAKANSGMFLQGRYEIQILDSYGIEGPGKGDCGAIYKQFAPLVNACRPPLVWQRYDVIFRAARVQGAEVAEPARVTVLQNGWVIHNNVQLEGVTEGAINAQVGEPGPLVLQDHGAPVAYRNLWVISLPLVGSNTYGPR